MKIFFLKRKWLTALVGLLVICLIFYLVGSPRIVGVAATERQLPIYSVEHEDKVISLSFDAAWGNEDTQLLIDILDKYDITATFFVVGSWVDKYPESVLALHEAGHEVMNHSDSHPHMSQLSREQIITELESCNDKIEAVTGTRPTLFRCPYGEYDDKVISSVRSIGMEPIQWDVDSLDWKELSASEITQRVVNGVTNGSIVLFHNAAVNTPEALPYLIEELISQGYSFKPISELIIDGNYTIDHTGRQFAATTQDSTAA